MAFRKKQRFAVVKFFAIMLGVIANRRTADPRRFDSALCVPLGKWRLHGLNAGLGTVGLGEVGNYQNLTKM